MAAVEAKPALSLPVPTYPSNPVTCCIVYRAHRGVNRPFAPVPTHNYLQHCIRVSENNLSETVRKVPLETKLKLYELPKAGKEVLFSLSGTSKPCSQDSSQLLFRQSP